MSIATETPLTKKDFITDQEVRWCPGCGDYAILNSVQQVFAELGLPREDIVVVSGIGCSSRLPYYVNTYGFHSIHGRATTLATGLKTVNPKLSVWVITGDGDGLSIGGNHMIHILRRNVDVKILLFNNKIYGLTKGQYSPTSEIGKKTKSSPYGTVDRPFYPISLALGAEATFVARSVDVYGPHLKSVIRRAADHRGSAFIEIYQNCNVFNDGAFKEMTEKDVRDDAQVMMEHGKPLVFGKNRDKGIRLNGFNPEVVTLGDGVTEQDLLVHDEHAPAALALILSRLGGKPGSPTPLGIFRDVEAPVFDDLMNAQVRDARERKGPGDLAKLLSAGDTWDVR
jgi:2-oxoglutarate ferredoxin oxidoreductase subunit beta